MLTKIKYFIRWIKFQLVYKPKYKNTYGIPCLCSNINHKFHESLWEKKVCELLSNYFPITDIKSPQQHQLPIKFDLIVEDVAVYEPHAIFSSKQENNSYFSYYKDRRNKLNNFKEYKSLPMVVISNSNDFSKLKAALEKEPSKASMNQLVIDLLSAHTRDESKSEFNENHLSMKNLRLLKLSLLGGLFVIVLIILVRFI